jgi:Ca2+/Na+ antiporter
MVAEVTLWLVLTTGCALELLGRLGQPLPAGIILGVGAGAVACVRLRAARRFPGSERVPLSLIAVVLATVVVLAGTLVLWAAVMLVQA